jgi:hypothetical protein
VNFGLSIPGARSVSEWHFVVARLLTLPDGAVEAAHLQWHGGREKASEMATWLEATKRPDEGYSYRVFARKDAPVHVSEPPMQGPRRPRRMPSWIVRFAEKGPMPPVTAEDLP